MTSTSTHTKPVVSVVMITYLHEQFLKEAIESILMQNCGFHFELIIADDNSPDNTSALVQPYLNSESKNCSVRYIRQETNKGVTGNFLFAIEQCKGDFIAFCEGDDFWTDPNKLQIQVDFLSKNKEFVLSFHDSKTVDKNSVIIDKSEIFTKKNRSAEELSKGAFVPIRNMCFRSRDLHIPDEMRAALLPDVFLTAVLGRKGPAYFDESILGSAYRIHSGGVWSSQDEFKKMRSNYENSLLIYAFFNRVKSPIQNAWKTTLHKIFSQLINLHIELDGHKSARKFISSKKIEIIKFSNLLEYLRFIKHTFKK
ncbi:MAG: glycosyltransferase [Crocinitomicaceae bacterium]|nr:glycosyltransferase [Crocinitomicaceae bacterium]